MDIFPGKDLVGTKINRMFGLASARLRKGLCRYFPKSRKCIFKASFGATPPFPVVWPGWSSSPLHRLINGVQQPPRWGISFGERCADRHPERLRHFGVLSRRIAPRLAKRWGATPKASSSCTPAAIAHMRALALSGSWSAQAKCRAILIPFPTMT
jgi:hypothetical protein